MYGYVYLTTNSINGKKYVGMHKADKFDDSYLGSGKLIKRAIKKYGKENFKIELLKECHSEIELVEAELTEIFSRKADSSDEYYNIIRTAQPILLGMKNGFFGKHHSDETKEKLSISSRKNRWSPTQREKYLEYLKSDKGILHKQKLSKRMKILSNDITIRQKINDIMRTDEFRKSASENQKRLIKEHPDRYKNFLESKSMLGRKFSEEHKRKISDSLKGRKNSWVAEKINRNPEKIEKTRQFHLGRKRSKETCQNISESLKGKPTHNKGTIFIHNPDTNERMYWDKTKPIPEGYIRGHGKKKQI